VCNGCFSPSLIKIPVIVEVRVCLVYSATSTRNRRSDRHRWTSTISMGIFLVPVPPKGRQPKLSAEDRIWTAKQDGRPLERYVEEFTELSSKVSWPEAILNSCFLRSLDKDTIRDFEPECLFFLVESINLILFLNGSEFEIEEVQNRLYSPRPAPSETQVAWPVHQPPNSSTYRSSGHSVLVLSDPQPKPPKKKRSSQRSRRPQRMGAFSPELPTKPASEPEMPTPVPEGLLIEYEGMSWTPSPDPSPAFHEPAPAFDKPALIVFEPAPTFLEPAPALNEPAPALNEPAPALNKPAPASAKPATVLDGPSPPSSIQQPAPVTVTSTTLIYSLQLLLTIDEDTHEETGKYLRRSP